MTVVGESVDAPSSLVDEWNVRELINHLVRGNRWTIENLRTGGVPRPTEDLIGDRLPLDVYTRSAEAMIAAFQEPGALAKTVQMLFGELSGTGLAGFRFNDLPGRVSGEAGLRKVRIMAD